MFTPPPRQPNECFNVHTLIIAFTPRPGLCKAQLWLSPSLRGCIASSCCSWPCRAQRVTIAQYLHKICHFVFLS